MQAVYDQPSREALQKAKAEVEAKYLDPNSSTKAHSIAIGEIIKNGEPTGEIGVIVMVQDKPPSAELPRDEMIPPSIQVATNDPHSPPCETVKIDIQQMDVPTVELLRLSEEAAAEFSAQFHAEAIGEWRTCFQAPIPGGPQIAPRGAGWVGTLSGACMHNGKPAAFTNYHVASVNERLGIEMCQPSGSGPGFAKVVALSQMNYAQNGANRTDFALLDTYRQDYGPSGGFSVCPEQFKIGRINPEWRARASQQVGDAVQKSGRTTGLVKGRVTGIDGTTHVGYDNGTARFVGQLFIRANAGLFSSPGDSGSMILDDQNRPYGLLFAGGGGVTIANPIQYVVEDHAVTFF